MPQAPYRLYVPEPATPLLTGHLPFADAPHAPDPIEVTSRYLTRGGRPWFPVSGEFHYTRFPAGQWEEELLKMKAGGVTAVASYLIWIHHEEVEGRVRFDGDRDLRRFAELCARHGLDFIPRIGPWSHAEVRNGGLPDWLLAREVTPRTDDPGYLTAVRAWFGAVGEQLSGLDRAHGGPIVAIQIENELYDQPGHLLTLKRMAQEAGLSAPLWTSTAWGGVRLPPDELLPLYGGYTETFWTEWDGGWPDTCRKHFFFTHQRDDEGIGSDLRPTAVRGADPLPTDRFPWATCELGGGMAVAYHRRPRVDAADLGALGLTKIGCGSVWQGYYMFHGGTNPAGELSTLQESHATGYPNDLPVLTYDFQAPLGEYGQVRPSYGELRLQHLMLADFGHLIAPMESVLPERQPDGQDDRGTLRWAVRADAGGAGFLFVNNHQPHEALPDHQGTRFEVSFSQAGPLSLPSTPVTVPAGAYFCWPLRLDIGGLRLDWATAQPVCTLDDDGRPLLMLAATEGIAPELALDAGTVDSVSVLSGDVDEVGDRILVSGLRPGTDALVEVRTADGGRVGLLVLDAATARTAYRGRAWGAERLVLSADSVVFDEAADEVRVHSASGRPSFAVLPAPSVAPAVAGVAAPSSAPTAPTPPAPSSAPTAPTPPAPSSAPTAPTPPAPSSAPAVARARVGVAADGVFTRYTVEADGHGSGALPLSLVREAGPVPVTATGVLGRASAPADKHFESAAEYRIDVPDELLADPAGVLLHLSWSGDVGRAYAGGVLVADQFHAGRPTWDIALDRLPVEALRARGLRVRVLARAADAPVYVPEGAGDGREALVRDVTWTRVRTWGVGVA
ncbi:beta-galactosidase [Streptomyces sp. TRM66268-LWL]|uniref:Beta-galactosidase n=1 Tax=Streptomyces polyasparticus TaxID=2767826 RepID=A0ABR7SQC0_9ACTN|nr:beta-galactosidase [Streptomyces polyasparticus]MBC9717696.1 beta-galactosidase [Streptomyces polyasparticus]